MSLYLGNSLIPGVSIGDSATQENLSTELSEQDILIANIINLLDNSPSIKEVVNSYEQKITEMEYDFNSKLEALTEKVEELEESWGGQLAFSGQYATSTYFTAEGCSVAVDNAKGMAFVTIQGSSDSSWEHINFSEPIVPAGVSYLPTQNYSGTSGTASKYYTQVFTGIKGRINVLAEFLSTTNGSDSVSVQLTVMYA